MKFMNKWRDYNTDGEMNIVDHLTKLRKRIIVTFIFFFLFFFLGFVFVQNIYSFFINDIDIELMVISPTEIIWIYISMVPLSGLLVHCQYLPIKFGPL